MAPSATEPNGVPSHTNGNSNAQTNGASSAASEFTYPEMATPYQVLPQYHSKPTKLRVACIGAGASGLCLAYKMVSGVLCALCLCGVATCVLLLTRFVLFRL